MTHSTVWKSTKKKRYRETWDKRKNNITSKKRSRRNSRLKRRTYRLKRMRNKNKQNSNEMMDGPENYKLFVFKI